MLVSLTKILPFLGFIVSINAFYVHRKATRSAGYQSWCDFSPAVSCTRAVSSPYGEILTVSNGTYGAFFFAILYVVGLLESWTVLFRLAVPASMIAAYLTFSLYA